MAFAWKGSANGGTLLLGSGLAGRGFAATGTPISTVSQSTVAYTEAETSRTWTLTLDGNHPVGQFADGNMFVVTTSSGSVTATSPASEAADGYVKNGVMKDAYLDDEQGWEEMWGVVFNKTSKAYLSTKNIAPGVHGNGAIAWDAGDEFSLTTVLRKEGVTSPSTWGVVDTAITITFLPEAPPVGTLMPAPGQLAPKTLFNINDKNTGAFRSLTFPASWTDTTSSILGAVPHDLMRYGAGNVEQRRIRLDINNGATSSNYDAQVVDDYAKLMMWRHKSGLSTEDKEAIEARIIKNAIQVYGTYTRGGTTFASVGGGAGQCDGGAVWLWHGAFLLGNATMLAAAKAMADNMEGQSLWVTEAMEGIAVTANENNDDRAANQTFFSEHVGMPWTQPTAAGSNYDTLYGVIGQHGTGWYNLAVAMLQDGPSGETGYNAQLRGGAFNSSNANAASLAFLNRYRYWSPWYMGAYDPGARFRDLYDVVWPLTGLTELALRPDQIPDSGITLSTPASGQIGISTTATGYSNDTITQHDARYSPDGVQWVEVANTGAVGTLTGLRQGLEHLVGVRARNATGIGLWSLNYPKPDGVVRNKITTTGTESAAPAFDGVDPVICAKIHPAWWAVQGNYAAASGTLDDEQVQLAVGLGYPSGNFTLAHYSFQMKRDGVDISGATSQFYDRTAADAGAVLTCVVTIDNGVDMPVSHTTAGVTCPALNTLPSTVLIDTGFTNTFAVDYETEIAAITTSSANAVHEPGAVFYDDLQEIESNPGALKLEKTSTFPSFRLPCQNTAVAGTTYTVTAQVVHQGDANANPSFNVINAAGSSVLTGGAITLIRNTSVTHNIANITAEIVVAGGETDLDFRVQLSGGSASGLTGGGSPWLTQIKIEEAA